MKCNLPLKRFQMFTDEEVYMLSRQAIHGSYAIMQEVLYSAKERKIHGKLLNELLYERKLREDK